MLLTKLYVAARLAAKNKQINASAAEYAVLTSLLLVGVTAGATALSTTIQNALTNITV